MKIYGFQKLTLLDYPGKTSCTVFTGGCNFRCPFCHNSDLVLNPHIYPEIAEEEIFEFLKKRKNIIEAVCITGGEPMLIKELPDFVKKLRNFDVSVKIDTNGSCPDMLKYMVNEELADYIAMDVKNSFDKYGMTIGIDGFELDAVKESISFLKQSKIDREFRTTVCKNYHTKDDLVQIALHLGASEKYYLQSFKDSGTLMEDGVSGYSPSEMRVFLEEIKRFAPKAQLRGV